MVTDFRINEQVLVKISDSYVQNKFWKTNNEQYIYNGDDVQEKNLYAENAVWFSGEFIHRVNKVYDSPMLITPSPENSIEIETSTSECRLLLRQGFDFTDVFGLLVIMKDMLTDEVLISRMFFESDFHISDLKELVNGSFWIEETIFKFPRTRNNIMLQATTVRFTDVTMEDPVGLILNFPNEFIPLIGEKPTPDFIKTSVQFDESHWIVIQPYTTENKTLQKSILDYFGLEIAAIDISHVIRYGDEDTGYKTIRVTNEDNVFGEVNIGINLLPFKKENITAPGQNIVTVFVSTEIVVDNKLMKREASITTDLFDTINPLVTSIIKNPETVFPVNVNEEVVIKNTVIEQNVLKQIVPISQPVFVKFIDGDITYNKLNVTLNNITEPCHLTIMGTKNDEEQSIVSRVTVDNTYYFNLSDLQPITANTTYEIKKVSNGEIIGQGKFLLPKQ